MYRFKECREAKGFSQKFVALSLGVKPPSISDWENGKTKPTRHHKGMPLSIPPEVTYRIGRMILSKRIAKLTMAI